jgi:hypothetical protein
MWQGVEALPPLAERRRLTNSITATMAEPLPTTPGKSSYFVENRCGAFSRTS